MCLSIPAKITNIDQQANSATVNTMGVERQASLVLLDEEVQVGDYVLVHVGFAMSRIDEEDALESLRLFQAIAEGRAPR